MHSSIRNRSTQFPLSSSQPATLVDLLRLRALEQANRLAYRFLLDGETEEAVFTYHELDRQAQRIGACLQSCGASGERVLLLYPHGLEYLSALMGCLYAGAIAVPVYPPRRNRNMERLQAIVADAEAAFALTTSSRLSRLDSMLNRSSSFKSLQAMSTDDLDDNLIGNWQPPQIDADTLAILQYTSGSTGTPKAVMLSHRNLMHNSAMLAQGFEYSADSHVVSWLPIYHDMGLIGGILQPLSGGYPCTLMSPTAFLQRPFRWLQAVSRYRATISGGPNFAYELCARKITPEQRATLDLSSWVTAFNGSEPIREETLNRFASEFAQCGFRAEALYPCYGLAEATLIVSGGLKDCKPLVKKVAARALEANLFIEAAEGGEEARSIVGCGRALLDEKIVIAHPESLTGCLPGEVGEIWVSGDHIAQGYWNKPEETEHTFRARLRDTGEGPFLRTGDLGCIVDGELFVTGRLKDLIIIRGLNHYPQDIERTVERSHTALRPGGGAAFSVEVAGEEKLVVVQEIDVRQHPDFDLVIEQIRQAVAEEFDMQVYAIALIRAGSIAKTSSGKIQRGACRNAFLDGTLQVLSQWQATSAREYEPARAALALDRADRIEDWLVDYLAARTGLEPDQINTKKPISRYGIDSLMAIELVYAIETTLDITIPIASFLESPTVEQIAAHAMERLASPVADQAFPAAAENRQPSDSPLSRGQQALWFLHQLDTQSTAYHISTAIRISSELDSKTLRRAFEGLIARHAMLRTTFTVSNGEPVQRIHEQSELDFQEQEAADWTEDFLNRKLVEEANRPFDLENGPLLRVHLFRRSASNHVLLLVVHHIIADFWSLAVLMHEMGIIYSAEKNGAAVELPPLPVQYSDYVRWQESMLASPSAESVWAHWQQQLAGELPLLNLPTDRPRPSVQTYNGASFPFKLSAELTGKLRQLSQATEVTLYRTLLAAFQVFLHRHTKQNDILVGSLSAGRSRNEFSGLVGYFVNPIVMRGTFSPAINFEAFLEQTRQTALGTSQHQDYPFALLVERLQPQRDPSRSPIFQAMFVLQKTYWLNDGLSSFALGEAGTRMELGELSIESLALQQRVAQFDLTLVMAETGDGMSASLQYNRDLFDPATAALMAERFKVLLEGITANPQQPVATLPLLNGAEESRLLNEWNSTETAYASDRCVHHFFEQRVEESPGEIALVFRGDQVTFAELNRRANQLAHHLEKLGAGPEVPVGLYVERSIEMMVGLLGILKAGAAYVPIDSTLPKQRLAFMLEDANVPLLITQEHLAARLPALSATVVHIDSDWSAITEEFDGNLLTTVQPDNLAYLIYTSGSTGKPKAVMIQHRNVINFFNAMDEKIGCNERDSLLAVTSISFDISVLELLWTLTRGTQVVLMGDKELSGFSPRPKRKNANQEIQFSLFYFASDQSGDGQDRYRLLFEGAKFADRNGFKAVWTPERHFHAFGGLYPNPSVTGAALAAMTDSIEIRAGSVVMPLHHPIRVAEEWALVDNISKGRVGIAFASGWHSDDFVFFPENYEGRKEVMLQGIDTVQNLWRGEAVKVRGGAGNEIEVKIFPKPIQSELPIWLTAAGAPDTFVKAGEIGANVLTHLLGQSVQEVAERIRLYRESLIRHGRDPQSGHVTLMLHTFIGENRDTVREKVRVPFTNYLRSSIGLIANLIKSMNLPLDLNTMTEKDMDDLLAFAFDRYFETSALFGTPETCREMIEQVKEMGVDEVACLIDFGVDVESALASLEQLRELKELSNNNSAEEDYSLAAQASRHNCTLLQCTPSTMRMLNANEEIVSALKPLRALLLGGEAFPANLATELKESFPGKLFNMYGPTETTIWSALNEVTSIGSTVHIGRPIANTQIYMLDEHLNPVPTGVAGELYIGGDGVARGYFNRPDLSAERFLPNPFGKAPGARFYRTGDLARFLPDGTIEFLGRADHQVKIRGYRIELEEIESILGQHPAIQEAVVVARDHGAGDIRLVAYSVAAGSPAPDVNELCDYLKDRLPNYMVPSTFMTMEAFPLTANGKVDRKALPAPTGVRPELKAGFAAPRSILEQNIAKVWQGVLKLEQVGIHDNFFDLGGHSLLMVQVHSQLREILNKELALIKLLEYPTISSLARYLSSEHSDALPVEQNYDMARKQREALKRQRQNVKARLGFQ